MARLQEATVSQSIESMLVADVLRTWPDANLVFLHNKMACPGCLMAKFMTVSEAASEYGLTQETFIAELSVAIEQDRNE